MEERNGTEERKLSKKQIWRLTRCTNSQKGTEKITLMIPKGKKGQSC